MMLKGKGKLNLVFPISPSLPLPSFPPLSPYQKPSSFSSCYRAKGGWQKVYLSLDNFQLKFYTDHKVAIDMGAKPLSTFHLLHATVCTYSKEKRIKHAFLVRKEAGCHGIQKEAGCHGTQSYGFRIYTVHTCVYTCMLMSWHCPYFTPAVLL